MRTAITAESPGFVLTGRKVFLAFVLFFGTVASADGFLLLSAIRTWSGAETTSAYKAGQLYNGELTQAREQTARGWHLAMTVERAPGGGGAVRVTAQDASGAALAGKTLVATLQRPTDKRADRSVELSESLGGAYAGEVSGTLRLRRHLLGLRGAGLSQDGLRQGQRPCPRRRRIHRLG